VAQEAAGRGIGGALLSRAKAESPRLHLRADPGDRAVCRFYRREGFSEDGQGADPAGPALRFQWRREDEA